MKLVKLFIIFIAISFSMELMLGAKYLKINNDIFGSYLFNILSGFVIFLLFFVPIMKRRKRKIKKAYLNSNPDIIKVYRNTYK